MKDRKIDSQHNSNAIHKTREKSSVLLLSAFVGFTICCFAIVCWYYGRPSVTLYIVGPEDKSDISPVCTGTSDSNKFDCHPDAGATEKSCLERGCCFEAKDETSPTLSVPYCFYPSNYNGYSVGQITQDGRYIKADLKRSSPSGFPHDIQNLRLVVSFIDDCTLRIKITDANAARFEVPIPINDELKPLKEPCYDVLIDAKSGELRITRKSTANIIFRTYLSQLVYSDQFLQLSTHLPSPYIYGIGEHYSSFLRSVNWTKLTIFNTDREPLPNYPLYGSHPFYLSLEEGGNVNGVFLLNSNAMDVILQPAPAITFRPIGGILDFFVMLGPSPANVVQQFTGIVGRTFMPPYWSLGFHLCRYGYDSLNNTKETLQRNLDAGIPVDVQWNDIDYMERYKDFTYDSEKFDGLPEYVEDLHNKGMHYVIMIDPGISCSEKPGTYPPYDDGLKDDVFIKNPDGTVFRGKVWTDGETVYPDFSHPNASDYWTRHFANFYSKVNYDGVWIDMNEPSNFYDGGKDGCMKSSYEDPYYLPTGDLPLRHKTLCMTAKHHSTIHYNEHNLMAYREATATNQALKNIRQKRPFIISRASFSGQGAQSGHWSGDIISTWDDMRYSVQSMLNFNLYGMSMIGSDICGFGHDTTVELCARWQSLGAFYPFSRNHNDRGAKDQDPAILGPTVVAATKRSLSIRYLLLPYLYTLFARSHIYGDTVVRPLFFEYPQDTKTYAIEDQFLWGPALMIIPALYQGTENVTAYFPVGKWYDSAGKPIEGAGGDILFHIPLTDIAIAFRGGFIFPAQLPASNTEVGRKQPFIIMACLDENMQASGELYWDDGDSLDTYEKGNYTLIHFSIKDNTLTSTLVNSGYGGAMALGGIQIAGITQAPTEVTVNGVNCARQPTADHETEMPLFGQPKIAEMLKELPPGNSFCVYAFIAPYGISIGTSGYSLLSPVTATWK